MTLTLAVTGHRPEEFTPERAEKTKEFLNYAFKRHTPDLVVCGMAAGVDLWAGIAALDGGIAVVAAKPWAGHQARRDDVDAYERIVREAVEVVDVNDSDSYPGPWVYQKRNEYMVGRAQRVLAVWNGKAKGGTFNCVEYARRMKKPILQYNHNTNMIIWDTRKGWGQVAFTP